METFVVRVWVPASGEPSVDGVHGTVMHIASGSTAPFSCEDELVAFVRSGTPPPKRRDTGSMGTQSKMQPREEPNEAHDPLTRARPAS